MHKSSLLGKIGAAHFILSWYLTVVFTFLFASMMFLHTTLVENKDTPIKLHYQLYKSLPASETIYNKPEVKITKADGRYIIIRNFFQDHDAPLSAQAEEFVKVADRYQLDYRLLPAISMQESSGGKRLPEDSYNPFGYGIYGDKVTRFASYVEAIDKVGQGLKKNYIDQGLTDPYKIMLKYTPPSLEKGGPWAIGVNSFMEELR